MTGAYGSNRSGAPADHAQQARSLATRLFMASLGSAELITAYLGMRLGLYSLLAERAMTPAELAEHGKVAPRYAREWLEQQAAAGIVTLDRAGAPELRYSLPPGHAEVLNDPDSLFSVVPLTVMPVGGFGKVVDLLLDAFRTGDGIPYDSYGADFRGGQGGLNKPVFRHLLPGWIRTAMPDLHSRLAGGGTVADVGCGAGWAGIALAGAYPRARIDGYDFSPVSVAEARRNARDAGVAERVTFTVQDGAAPAPAGRYDLVCVFDALHDMARPVEVLRSCRSMRAEGGTVLLMEPKVGERFAAPADETERFFYAVSVLHCLPVGLSEQPSAGTGTVIRPDLVRRYARSAGFSGVRALPVEHRFYRLYRLTG